MEIDQLIVKAQLVVEETFKSKLPAAFCFHDLRHTRLVANSAYEIGMECGLSKIELQTVLLAATLHDVGYTETCEGHEAASARYAASFLRANNISEKMIEDVEGCIMATKFPQQPSNIIQEVICDADLYHLSLVDYDRFSQALNQEMGLLTGFQQNQADWDRSNLEFLQNHTYFTAYGREVLQLRKMKNIENLAVKVNIRLFSS